jgi:hypothetical protein
MSDERKIISEEEFAKEVGRSKYTIARLRKAKKIIYRRDGQRVYYIAPDDIESYHRAMQQGPRALRA